MRIAPKTFSKGPTMSPIATQTIKSNRITPRWFALPVVREIPAPPAQVGSAW